MDLHLGQHLWIIFMIILLIISIKYFNQLKDPFQPVNETTKEKYNNFIQDGEIQLKDGYYVIRGSRNNQYCSDSANGMICNADMAGPQETFYIQKLNNGEYAIQSTKNNLWCSQTSTGMRCLSSTISDNEVFNIIHVGKGKFAILNTNNKLYCVDNGNGLSCNTSLEYKNDYDLFEFRQVSNQNKET